MDAQKYDIYDLRDVVSVYREICLSPSVSITNTYVLLMQSECNVSHNALTLMYLKA